MDWCFHASAFDGQAVSDLLVVLQACQPLTNFVCRYQQVFGAAAPTVPLQASDSTTVGGITQDGATAAPARVATSGAITNYRSSVVTALLLPLLALHMVVPLVVLGLLIEVRLFTEVTKHLPLLHKRVLAVVRDK
jgi:hypothetical protein